MVRLESDSVGTLEVPAQAYYGVQTLRGYQNFPMTGRRLHPALILALARVKKAAARTNYEAGMLSQKRAEAIEQACDEILAGRFHDQFILDPIQGGAGTSANMNANEVIANRAGEILGSPLGQYDRVHPNDHVNMAQSTNDVFPSAGKLAAHDLLIECLAELERLVEALKAKAVEFDDIIKVARTQLQDAVPMRLGQSFQAYASAISRDIRRLNHVLDDMTELNMGGTAIGTGINASPYYIDNIARVLSTVCGYPVKTAPNLIDATQNLDTFVLVSGIVKTCAVTLSKIANDMRLLSSGPKTGVAEINLPAKQNGSSIMPGKVNPVIPEVVSQVAFNIIGNDLTITMCAEAGQLELNAFEPVLFYNLFESIETLGRAAKTFTDNCISGITANREHCRELLEQSLVVVTALCPYIGYKKAANLANEALRLNRPIRQLIREDGAIDDAKLEEILDPQVLTHPRPFAVPVEEVAESVQEINQETIQGGQAPSALKTPENP